MLPVQKSPQASVVLAHVLFFFFLLSPSILAVNIDPSCTLYPMNDEIHILFAGNPLEEGGPYWAYLTSYAFYEENGKQANPGYYCNDSHQQEDWMYINISVRTANPVETVWLQWYDNGIWTNWTYSFWQVYGEYYELWTQHVGIQPSAGHRYSFDVVVNTTRGKLMSCSWEKIGVGGSVDHPTRRYVYLNTPPVDSLEYSSFFLYITKYFPNDCFKKDALHHDQGPDGSNRDTGYLHGVLPTDQVSFLYCGGFVGFWFDDSKCIPNITLDNIYFHVWWSSLNDYIQCIGWMKSRDVLMSQTIDGYKTTIHDSQSSIVYDNGNHVVDDMYHLDTHLLDITDTVVTDNTLYEFAVTVNGGNFPSVVSNRSFPSYILINVPTNDTLNQTYGDSDKDGLSDWTELYITATHPFLSDTDDDGATDYEEVMGESFGFWNSDPNNYTNMTLFRRVQIDVAEQYLGFFQHVFYFLEP